MENIVTERLYLRRLQVKDVTDKYVDTLNDYEVVRLTGAKHSRWTRNKVEEYVKRSNIEGESLLIGVFLKESERHIGNIRLFNFDKNHSRVELGIMIFDKSEWGKGYGYEALSAAVRYVFDEIGLHRIHADYYAVNTGSANIFKKAGFEIEGVYKDHFLLDGKYIDSVRIAKINPKEKVKT